MAHLIGTNINKIALQHQRNVYLVSHLHMRVKTRALIQRNQGFVPGDWYDANDFLTKLLGAFSNLQRTFLLAGNKVNQKLCYIMVIHWQPVL